MTEGISDERAFADRYLKVNPADEANYARKARGYARRYERILAEAAPDSVLDLGCASGLLTNWLCRRGCKDVVGVDLSAPLIEVARKNVPAEFVVDDAAHYVRTCGRKFDVVFMTDLLEHIEKPAVLDLLRGVREILNEGGFAIVRVPNLNCLGGAGWFYSVWVHVTPFTERSLCYVAEQAGFSRTVFCNQFRMQNFKGKIRACINAIVVPAVVWLRGGRKVKVYYRNLVARLYP